MEKTQEFRLTLTRDELKGLLNNMADQVYDFYIQQNEQQQAQKRLVKTMPMVRNEQLVQEEVAAYAEAFESGAGNLIYHIDMVKAKAIYKEVKSLKDQLPKEYHYKGIEMVKGLVSSDGNKDSFKNTKAKVGIMSEKQRKQIQEAFNLVGLDLNVIRATPKQVEASKKENADRMKKAA